jgi:hypothetical protein
MFTDTGARWLIPPPPPSEGSICIYALPAMSHLWCPISDFTLEHPVREEALDPTIVLRMSGADAGVPHTRSSHWVNVTVASEVLHAGAYTLRVADCLEIQSPETEGFVDYTTISVDQLQELAPSGLVAKLLAVSRPVRGKEKVLVAGYTLYGSWGTNELLWVRREVDEEGRVLGFENVGDADLSYNGGLFVLYRDRTVVSYYA